MRKPTIILLTLAAIGSCGLWLAAYTIVGEGFEDFENGHGVSVTFRRSNGHWGLGATDLTGQLFLISIRKIEDSLVVPERFYSFADFDMHTWAYQSPALGRIISHSFSMPLWALPLLFGAYPTVALIRGPVRRWRRRKHHQCIHCGYDLTGLTEPRCPECGKAI